MLHLGDTGLRMCSSEYDFYFLFNISGVVRRGKASIATFRSQQDTITYVKLIKSGILCNNFEHSLQY